MNTEIEDNHPCIGLFFIPFLNIEQVIMNKYKITFALSHSALLHCNFAYMINM